MKTVVVLKNGKREELDGYFPVMYCSTAQIGVARSNPSRLKVFRFSEVDKVEFYPESQEPLRA